VNRIEILPESVQKKIAAGEVVEGPFSIVKELIENSIDADSMGIDVEVYDSGFKKILIKDNGCGIHKDDLALTIIDHATSKIRRASDIEQIVSYGFRGEALSSISSISQLTILTRANDEEIGSKLTKVDDNIDISDYAGSCGTTVIVENLFFSTPARKKFLKGKRSELRRIREIFLKIALVNFGIGFSFSVDKKRKITLPVVDNVGKRIEQIYGRGIVDNLYFDRLQDLKVGISGFLSKPQFFKSSRSMQILYVNNRIVEYRLFGFLLSKAYEALAPKGRYPAAIIFLTIDPELVDVNIHPAKREVKFFDQKYINVLILHLAEKILSRQVHNIDVCHDIYNETRGSFPENDMDIQYERKNLLPSPQCSLKTDQQSVGTRINNESVFNEMFLNPKNSAETTLEVICDTNNNPKTSSPVNLSAVSYHNNGTVLNRDDNKFDDIRFLGIAFNTYILVEEGDAIQIIDFHAAHERIIFDSLIKEDLNIEKQELIFPQVLELSVEDYQTVFERKDYFLRVGFDIENFSDSSIVIRGIPVLIDSMNVEQFFMDVIEAIGNDGDYIRDVKDIIAEKVACHSAKRSGDNLSVDDALRIAYETLKVERLLRCPHGRPCIYKLQKSDLTRIFKR